MAIIGLDNFTCLFCGSEHPGHVTRCPDTGEKLEKVHKLEGRRLDDKYIVGRIIAEGGMGAVYEGKHAQLDRKVAIKFLHHFKHASEQMIERFRNEARIAAAVGHENIVDVLDMGVTSGTLPYIVMEYLEGNDLSTFLEAADRLPQQWAVDITIQILSALRAVHAKGVVHRDLKPANIFLVDRSDGGLTVKIVDFGISRLHSDKTESMDLTRTGAVLGTPHYMAPEQARGKRTIDHRSDLYSVGVILYRLLTGNYPFDSEDYNNLIISITTEEPVHVGKHAAGLPPGLQAVVMWSIARDQEDRFADADEFIEALVPYRDGDPETLDDDSQHDGIVDKPSNSLGWGQSTPEPGRSVKTAAADREKSIQEIPTAPPPAKAQYPPAPSTRDDPPPPPDSVTFPSVNIEQELSGPAQRGVPEASITVPEEPINVPQAPINEPQNAASSPRWEASAPLSTLPEYPANRTIWTSIRINAPVLFAMFVLVGIVAGFATFIATKTISLENDVRSFSSASPAMPRPTVLLTVKLEGVPDEAEVYVDGVLHPERPLMIEAQSGARWIKIVSDDHETWENRVALKADVTINARLKPLPDPDS